MDPDAYMKVNPMNPPGEWKAIPDWMKVTMVFIDRVGFPILAYILMSYTCLASQAKITTALTENTQTLVQLKASIDTLRAEVRK